jgi:hypothetical protein
MAEFAFSSRTAELLAQVVSRLEAEFPGMPRAQVERCVQVAREPAKATAGDVEAYANIVEVLARDYLLKLQEIRSKGQPPIRSVADQPQPGAARQSA